MRVGIRGIERFRGCVEEDTLLESFERSIITDLVKISLQKIRPECAPQSQDKDYTFKIGVRLDEKRLLSLGMKKEQEMTEVVKM
jgi:hypothetical protein